MGTGVIDARTHLDKSAGPALYMATVVAPQADLRPAPTRDSSTDTQLLHGWHMRIHARQGPWTYGAALNPIDGTHCDYVGWVRARALAAREIAPTHRVTALRAPVFSRPDLKSPICQLLPFGARLQGQGEAVGNGGSYLRIGGARSGGFVSLRHLAPLGEALVIDPTDVAESFQGLPYIWGGNGPDGMDCSGLVKLAVEATGRACPRDADQQEVALGQAFPPDAELMNLRRSDLIFWPGHVGIMQTSGRLLHANAHHMRVATEPLRDAVDRIGPIRTARRFQDLRL